MIVSCKETNLKKDTREIILAAQTTLEEVKRGIGKLRGIIDVRKVNKKTCMERPTWVLSVVLLF